ncbi:uncharacterized protein LOC128552596 [Mercenaria mercenaria]|uniref:uncharacterized protein LOC128552596 n=1 Tax=Mercenaria mercenaria TaxID=6596 RepID=UPI00234EE540|nr:uncharacterized protein LOC128552596 [Mercenaria mercenaria]
MRMLKIRRSSSTAVQMDEFIKSHFNRGYVYKEILVLLKSDMGVDISIRQLKRHLNRLNLRRRSVWGVEEVQNAIQSELCGSGRNLGCRSMSQRLRSRHGMSVGRNMVLHQMRLLDPEGVEARRRHRLIRRIYRNKGPNFLVHMDGYDKIKRYGLAIHGAIDGYSRRVLWLKVNRTNNDPKVVASYFLEFVTEAKGIDIV